ncbi:MAG: class I SAM-dependent methyltransferase [Candidatus Thermoplasmatota archaeon]
MCVKFRSFGDHTERYEKWFEKNRAVYESELKVIKRLRPRQEKGIEVGVGSGRFSQPFSIQYGLDPSKEMLKIAEERNIQTILGRGEKLPFETSVFDYLLIVTTICFFEDPLLALKESYRVLKSDGKIIIGFIDKDSLIGREYQKKKEQNVFYREAEFYSVNEVEQMLKESGFSDFQHYQTIFQSVGSIEEVEESEEGYGRGSFVGIRARK